MENHIAKSEDIVWRRIGDEIVVIKDDGLSIHVLNKTAAFVWEILNGDCEPGEIATGLCERFDVSFEEASTDITDIIQKLKQLGLLRQAEEVTGQ